jgi:rod shape determining protein RodA
MISHFKKMDWLMITAAFLLVGFGLLIIYGICLAKQDFSFFYKQLGFFGFSVLLMFVFSFVNWRIFRENSYLILILYFFCLISLVGLFFFAPEIRGVQRWYRLGPFSLDPIEFTKIILIILLAKYFSTRHVEMYRFGHIIFSGIYIFLPAGLTFFQPDFGSILILFALWLGILIVSGIKIKHFLILVFCGIIIFSLTWLFLMKDYQKDRITSFLFPADPLGAGWSQNQARIAIGSGGVFGQGLFQGSQTQHGFLPEPQTDFIFSALAEETGLIGVIVLMVLFSVLIFRIAKIALESETNFPRLFSVGLIVSLIFQIFINVGMNLGILPIVGISLPFISYGGSNLIAFFIGLGILQNIKVID